MHQETFTQLTDQELLDRFYASGDNSWIGVLLERYTLLLLGVCMKYLREKEEAKDAVQQICMKVVTELSKYRVDYFKSWVYTIARNHCLMKLRHRHEQPPAALSEHMLVSPDEETGIERHMEKEHLLDLMKEALEELSPEQRRCLILFYLEKRSYQEIAAMTSFTLMQVKSHIQNGKRNLKTWMKKKTGEKSKS